MGIAFAHDVLITTGLIALTWTEFSMTAVAALLTLAGYSFTFGALIGCYSTVAIASPLVIFFHASPPSTPNSSDGKTRQDPSWSCPRQAVL